MKKNYTCPKCGEDKGLLWSKKVNGISPEDRPCKKCRNEIVSIKTKGRLAWNKGVPQSEETKKKIRVATAGKMPSTKGLKLSEDTKIKLSCLNQGISLTAFDGFTTLRNEAERTKLKKSSLRQQCFILYNFTCAACGIRGKYLNAHHKNSWKHFPDQRFLLYNLIALCKGCHCEFHAVYGNGGKSPNTENQIEGFIRSKRG